MVMRSPPTATVDGGALARLLARYCDKSPPSINEVRAAVAAFVAQRDRGGEGPLDVVMALEACVRDHVPPALGVRERRALVALLLRWASDARREMARARS
jgi:hypothetical protein